MIQTRNILILCFLGICGCLPIEEETTDLTSNSCESVKPIQTSCLCNDPGVYPGIPSCASMGCPDTSLDLDEIPDGIDDIRLDVIADVGGVGSSTISSSYEIEKLNVGFDSVPNGILINGTTAYNNWFGGSCLLMQLNPCPTGFGSNQFPEFTTFLVKTSQNYLARVEITDFSPRNTKVIGAGTPDNYLANDGVRLRWSTNNENGKFCTDQ